MAIDDRTRRSIDSTSSEVDWPTLLTTHGRWLRTVLLARVGDRSAVEDLLQDVRAAAIEKGHSLRDPAKAAPWLYRLAVLTALQHRRRLGRRRKHLGRYVERFPSVGSQAREPNPLEWLLAEERQSLVRQALTYLPPREAEMLLLKYTEDWTYHQIAQHLGLSTSAVEARLHRARQRMRQALAALDPSLAAVAEKP